MRLKHMVVDIIRSIDAFTGSMGTPYYPDIYYGVYDRWQNIVKNMLYVGVTLVSDALIVSLVFHVATNCNCYSNPVLSLIRLMGSKILHEYRSFVIVFG